MLDGTNSEIIDALAEYAELIESGKPFDTEHFLNRYSHIQESLIPLLAWAKKLNSLGMESESGLALSGKISQEKDRNFGNFILDRVLGKGAIATVFEATEHALGRKVALKIFTGISRLDPENLCKFSQEAKIAASLPHDHVVPIYSTGVESGTPYISMKLMEGGSLAEKAGTLTTRQIAVIGRDIASALDYSHKRGVLHRDIKPANILLDSDGRAHLSDFGLAVPKTAGEIRPAEGTIGYLSPELINHTQTGPTPLGDIYALGVTLYEAAWGRNPFTAGGEKETLTRIAKGNFDELAFVLNDFPVDLSAIIHKAMSFEPEYRYLTGKELASDLTRFLKGDAVSARTIPKGELIGRWAKKHAKQIYYTGALLFSGLVITGAVLILQERDHSARQSQLLAKSEREQEITALAAGKMIEVARGFRNLPGLNDQERQLLKKYLDGISPACRELPPTHPLRAEEAILVSRISILETWVGNKEEANRQRDRAKSLFDELIQDHPKRIDLVCEQAIQLCEDGFDQIESRPERTLEYAREAINRVKTALSFHPESGTLLDRLVWSQDAEAQALMRLHMLDEANELLDEALATCSRLQARFRTGHPLSYIRPAILLDRKGQLAEKIPDFKLAEKYFDLASQEVVKMEKIFPENTRLRDLVGDVPLSHGEYLLRIGKIAESNEIIIRELPKAKQFVDSFPNLSNAQKHWKRILALRHGLDSIHD